MKVRTIKFSLVHVPLLFFSKRLYEGVANYFIAIIPIPLRRFNGGLRKLVDSRSEVRVDLRQERSIDYNFGRVIQNVVSALAEDELQVLRIPRFYKLAPISLKE